MWLFWKNITAKTLVRVLGAVVVLSLVQRTAPSAEPAQNAATRPAGEYKRPLPPAASERADERERMVTSQIAGSWDGRTRVKDKRVLAVLRAVPRHAFIPADMQARAYADSPLPIGHGQTISQPYIVALMTELLELTSDTKVLEIGTGSGYQAAVLAHLTPNVYTIEIVKPLAERAQRTLRRQGYNEIHCRYGDGYKGWAEEAPFDAIIVTCAPDKVPQPLWEQLKPGGRIVIPVGSPHSVQRLIVVSKTEQGKRRTKTIIAVRFVPMTRDQDRK